MATQSLSNPFADYGKIIHGDRFIGRIPEIRTIEQRVLGREKYGNLAIMGLPRVGKTSLAWQAIMEKKNDLLAISTIPVFVSVGNCKTSKDFYKTLVSLVNDEVEFLCEDIQRFNKVNSIYRQLNGTNDEVDFSLLIQKYFKFLKRLGYKTIYILDEFDSVQGFFEVADFQMLRELSTSPDTEVCLVTCSRKTIKEIEALNGAISNFYNTFKDLRLAMFSDDDFNLYWSWVGNYIEVENDYKEKAEFYAGRHPFLLDFYNNFCFVSKEIDDNVIISNLRLEFLNQFSTIQDTLKNEGLLDKAIQLVVGPIYDVDKISEEKLLKFGFIKVVDNEQKMNVLGRMMGATYQGHSYTCFSDYFTNVLERSIIEDIDYWPIWKETEKMVRALIKTYLNERYGTDWESQIVADCGKNPNWMTSFELLKSTREKTLRLFPGASNHLVDYTLTRDMYNVFINTGWGVWFNQIFGADKKPWSTRFLFLAEVRNPMAHNNSEFISEEQKTMATTYCQEIKNAIRAWGKKREG